MEHLMIALNVVIPLFLIMLCGYYFKEMKWLTSEFITGANKLSFNILLPLLLFSNIYQNDVKSFFDPNIILFALGSTIILVIMSMIIIPKFVHEPTHSSVIIQSLYRSNYVVLGIPIVTNYYGSEHLGVISMLVAFVVPLYNVLAVIIFEYFSPSATGHHLKHLLHNICVNPLIIAGLAGLLFSLLHLPLPVILQSTVDNFAKMAIPLALLILGADFELSKISNNIKALFFSVLGRLVLVPIIMIAIALSLGYRQVELLSLVVMFSAPISASSYIMACASDADCDLAGQTVVFTSLFSSITMVGIIALLTSWQFL